MKYKKGFTLIELLVVVSVIGTLATTILGSVSEARDRADVARFKVNLNSFRNGLELYYIDNGEYPKRPGANDPLFSWTTVDILKSELDGYVDPSFLFEDLPTGYSAGVFNTANTQVYCPDQLPGGNFQTYAFTYSMNPGDVNEENYVSTTFAGGTFGGVYYPPITAHCWSLEG